MSGIESGETFEVESDNGEYVFYLDHPFELHYACRSVRGWPKLLIEVWGVSEERESIAGYGVITLPNHPGQYTQTIQCWKPKNSIKYNEDLLGINPELEFRDVLLSTIERYLIEGSSTGTVEIEIGIISKSFDLHGVNI